MLTLLISPKSLQANSHISDRHWRFVPSCQGISVSIPTAEAVSDDLSKLINLVGGQL